MAVRESVFPEKIAWRDGGHTSQKNTPGRRRGVFVLAAGDGYQYM